MPKRIQRKRTKGWRLPPNTIIVSRPTRYGNPFRGGGDPYWAVLAFATWMQGGYGDIHPELVERRQWILEHVHELRDMDICCWCGLDVPCHGDVLLALANRRRAERIATDSIAEAFVTGLGRSLPLLVRLDESEGR